MQAVNFLFKFYNMSTVTLWVFLLISVKEIICDEHKNFGRAVNRFGDTVYTHLSKRKGNIIFSPLSVHSALSLFALGTAGDTRKQLLSNLLLIDAENLKRSYIDYARQISSDSSLYSANNLFISKGLHIRESYELAARNVFGVDPQNVDFRNPREASSVINKWVENHTDKKITKVLDENYLNPDTLILLLNAIYFKGKWKSKFDKSKTIPNYIFHAVEGDVECNMMSMRRQRHNYLFHPSFDMIQLDFEDTNIKIAFIRPHRNITQVEHTLNSEMFFQMIKNLIKNSIIIKIPKFKLESKFSLKKSLSSVGLTSIFHNPNLANLLERNLARVSDVCQKSFIQINEEGAIAVAATVVQLETRSTSFKRFVLDRPFLFFLFDSNSQVILMRGRIENPIK